MIKKQDNLQGCTQTQDHKCVGISTLKIQLESSMNRSFVKETQVKDWGFFSIHRLRLISEQKEGLQSSSLTHVMAVQLNILRGKKYLSLWVLASILYNYSFSPFSKCFKNLLRSLFKQPIQLFIMRYVSTRIILILLYCKAINYS